MFNQLRFLLVLICCPLIDAYAINPEARTVLSVDQLYKVVAFIDMIDAESVANVLEDASIEHRSVAKFYLIRYDHSEINVLMEKFDVEHLPTIIIYQSKKKGSVKLIKLIEGHDCTIQYLKTALNILRSSTTQKLTQASLKQNVLRRHKGSRPYLVLFYAHWCPDVDRQIRAFQRTAEDLVEYNSSIIPAVLDLEESRTVLESVLSEFNPKLFPFILYFYPIRIQQTEIQYLLLPSILPTPLNVIEYLQSQGHKLTNENGMMIDYAPWGHTLNQVSMLTEGPVGYECLETSSNMTDSDPKKWQPWNPPRNITKELPKPTRDWFNFKPVDLEAMHEKMEISVTGIPILTDRNWADLVEKSHYHSHPFGRIPDEATTVSIVIYVKADCDFCEKSSRTFQKVRDNVAMGFANTHVYLVNCTNSKGLCDKQSISGFPYLTAYRSISWLHHAECLSSSTAYKLKYGRHDYHGVVLLTDIMNWVAEVSKPAVQVLTTNEEKHNFHKLDTDAHLIATVISSESKYLPARKYLTGGKRTEQFPFECFRLVCERLYGIIGCGAEGFYKLDHQERDDLHTHISNSLVLKIELHRRDELETLVMESDRSFSRLMASERENTIHKLHKPHRYKLTETQTCEENHSACTDHILAYTIDHARLVVSTLDDTSFHSYQGIVGSKQLPVLAAFLHPENLTHNSSIYQAIYEAGNELYDVIRVVTVDVRQYHHWTNRIVPKHYNIDSMLADEDTWLYMYPRISMLRLDDHNHAAFYPDLNNIKNITSFVFSTSGIVEFAKKYLRNPQKLLVETEYF